jgi:inosose dehydratase
VASRIGNAPVSFGAWSLESSRLQSVPTPERVLAEVASAGYDGIELGPLGYLEPQRITAHGLELSGAYIPIPFGDGPGPLDATLDVFDAVAPGGRPIFADAGDNGSPLDFDDVARAAEHARERGYEPTFHHHMGTRVETPADIERFLEALDLALLLDTGHLAAVGADPVAALRDWRDRIDYVHVKDVDLAVLKRAPDWAAAWHTNPFCQLGCGDVDVRGFLAELGVYDGWLVVEQDWVPRADDDAEEQVAAQHRNRAFLG